jgi:glutathione S-transferase
MDVHMFSGSAFVWRVLLALEIKGVAYSEIPVQASPVALKSPDFLALNPRGKVPVIREGAYTLGESAAILAYLDRKYPEPPLFGRTPEETGQIWRAILDFDLYVASDCVQRVVVPIFTGQAAAKAETMREAARASHSELAKLDAAVRRHGWIAGPALNAADLAIFPVIEVLMRAAGKPDVKPLALELLPLEAHHPALAAWRAKLQAMPAYSRTYPAYWKKLDAAA